MVWRRLGGRRRSRAKASRPVSSRCRGYAAIDGAWLAEVADGPIVTLDNHYSAAAWGTACSPRWPPSTRSSGPRPQDRSRGSPEERGEQRGPRRPRARRRGDRVAGTGACEIHLSAWRVRRSLPGLGGPPAPARLIARNSSLIHAARSFSTRCADSLSAAASLFARRASTRPLRSSFTFLLSMSLSARREAAVSAFTQAARSPARFCASCSASAAARSSWRSTSMRTFFSAAWSRLPTWASCFSQADRSSTRVCASLSASAAAFCSSRSLSRRAFFSAVWSRLPAPRLLLQPGGSLVDAGLRLPLCFRGRLLLLALLIQACLLLRRRGRACPNCASCFSHADRSSARFCASFSASAAAFCSSRSLSRRAFFSAVWSRLPALASCFSHADRSSARCLRLLLCLRRRLLLLALLVQACLLLRRLVALARTRLLLQPRGSLVRALLRLLLGLRRRLLLLALLVRTRLLVGSLLALARTRLLLQPGGSLFRALPRLFLGFGGSPLLLALAVQARLLLRGLVRACRPRSPSSGGPRPRANAVGPPWHARRPPSRQALSGARLPAPPREGGGPLIAFLTG